MGPEVGPLTTAFGPCGVMLVTEPTLMNPTVTSA